MKVLSKECNFKSVSVEQCKEEYIRDTFVSGISSNNIRQRLLENDSLDLQTMVDQARALESAHKSAMSYQSVVSPDYALVQKDEQRSVVGKSCWNCGGPTHPKIRCPARNVDCCKCGNMAKYCKSPGEEPVPTVASLTSLTGPTLA